MGKKVDKWEEEMRKMGARKRGERKKGENEEREGRGRKGGKGKQEGEEEGSK